MLTMLYLQRYSQKRYLNKNVEQTVVFMTWLKIFFNYYYFSFASYKQDMRVTFAEKENKKFKEIKVWRSNKYLINRTIVNRFCNLFIVVTWKLTLTDPLATFIGIAESARDWKKSWRKIPKKLNLINQLYIRMHCLLNVSLFNQNLTNFIKMHIYCFLQNN